MQNINQLLQQDPLVRLLQIENFVGWVYRVDYEKAFVMTNDLWKHKASGIPHNCFLVASSFQPDKYTTTPDEAREVILLRVVGSCKLPQDDDLVRTKIDLFQQRTDAYGRNEAREYDDITQNQLQFGGLECRVLGTFFIANGSLKLGSDIESFAMAAKLNVYRPTKAALEEIVNYLDPIRRQQALEEARGLGLSSATPPFRIGTVRYTSTDRMHRGSVDQYVPVRLQSIDFLARRTAVLGMTRTGKSNMVKQLVSVVKRTADAGGARIGQIIYDLNGEYANANQADHGSLAEVYPDQTIRYRMVETPGFEELRNNFYEQLEEGFRIIKTEIGKRSGDYVKSFVATSFDEPDNEERGEHNRWQVRCAAYRVILSKAGFAPPNNYRVQFPVSHAIRTRVDAMAQQRNLIATSQSLPDPSRGMTLSDAAMWFEAARWANDDQPLVSTSGRAWVDESLQTLLDMIVQRSRGTNSFISGYRITIPAIPYHSPRRTADVAQEIYNHLANGRIVILDLSIGEPTTRQNVSEDIARTIFSRSMRTFVAGGHPPNIVIYIEEAHNLIGKDAKLDETWPRLAKEGAKFRIGLVYATQEVSSMHPNILSNTENWFITHLNNDKEIRELARFYDFDDFGRSLLRAQDVGFARVKTLSGPFVIPVQIDRFDPDEERRQATATPRGPPVS